MLGRRLQHELSGVPCIGLVVDADGDQQSVDRVRVLARGEPAPRAAVGHQADGIALAHRDIAQQQDSIECLVEVRTTIIPVSHASARVEQKDHLLVFFILVIPGDELALAGTGLPVDLPLAVALAKLPELKELVACATTLLSPDADLAQAIVCREQGVGADF